MKIHNLTVISLFFLMFSMYTADEEKPVLHFKFHTDPISRKVVVEKIDGDRTLTKKEIEQEVEKENINNVDIGNPNRPIYSPPLAKNIEIGDVKGLQALLESFGHFIDKNIFLNIESQFSINEVNYSYLIYKDIDKIRENYFKQKVTTRSKITKIRNIVDFAYKYAQSDDPEHMKQLVSQHDVDLDEFNKRVLIKLLEKLNEEITKLWEAIYIDLDNQMNHIEKILDDPNMAPTTKCGNLIEASLELTLFIKEKLHNGIEKMVKIRKLIMNNPKYHKWAGTTIKPLNLANMEKSGETEAHSELGMSVKLVFVALLFSCVSV